MKYLNDYATKLNLNVQLNTNITRVEKVTDQFVLTDQNGATHHCKILILRYVLHTLPQHAVSMQPSHQMLVGTEF